jgi:anhydro-N-acetylmuramic acid kinase
VRHQPAMGYTIQLNAPARIAETTGITVVSDFRSRDIAAGGQGAPLVPLFHQAIFGGADPSRPSSLGEVTVIINIGGMANITWLGSPLIGFDTGPGNVLMDLWVQQHQGKAFDQNGQWAQSGQVHAELLNSFYADPFFKSPPPKSTGRDLFSAEWLAQHLNQPAFQKLKPQDVQATLAMLTAKSIAHEIKRLEDSSEKNARCGQVLVCGGGEKNQHLMALLETEIQSLLGQPVGDRVGQSVDDRLSHQKGRQIPVHSTAVRGWPPQVIESAAFAWLAYRTLHNLPGNAPSVTGALGARILGSITPGAMI